MTQPLFIPFSYIDSAGILYFAKVFDIYHNQLELLLDKSMLWSDWFDNPTISVPLVHCESQFLSPIKAGENYDSQFLLVRLGSSSITMEMSILQTHKVYCKVKATHAFRKKSDFSKSPIPVSLSSWAHLLKHTTA